MAERGGELWAVCRHTRGGFKVWPLDRVLKMNLQRLMHAAPMDDEWRPLAVEAGFKEAAARATEIRREAVARRRTLAACVDGAVPYPEEEARLDGEAMGHES